MSERAGAGPAASQGKDRARVTGTVDGAPRQVAPIDPAELERVIAERREHLAATVDELVARAQPGEIARRGARGIAARLRSAAFTTDGEPRVERVAAVSAAITALVALVVWRRRRSG